jgi:hypothetical protein
MARDPNILGVFPSPNPRRITSLPPTSETLASSGLASSLRPSRAQFRARINE